MVPLSKTGPLCGGYLIDRYTDVNLKHRDR